MKKGIALFALLGLFITGLPSYSKASEKAAITDFTVIDKSDDALVLSAFLHLKEGDYLKLFLQELDTYESLKQDKIIWGAEKEIQTIKKEDLYAGDYINYLHTVKNLENFNYYKTVLKVYNNGTEICARDVFDITLLSNPEIFAYSKKYSLNGEKNIEIYGGVFIGHSYLTGFEQVGFEGDCFTGKADVSNCFQIMRWGEKSITVNLPEQIMEKSGKIEARKGYQEYPVIGKKEIIELYRMKSKEDFHVITCPDCFEKTIPSNYGGEDYRYLYNSLNYRYGKGEYGRSNLALEAEAAKRFRETMKTRLGRDIGVDALWFLNLFQAYYYGGYSEDDIVAEVLKGPGVVHVSIPWSSWCKTQDYISKTSLDRN